MTTSDEIAFRSLTIPADVDLVHGWMQHPHAAEWWHLAGPRELTRDYLYARLRLRHRDCWIAGDGSAPVAYVETFVVPDDPLGDRYEAQPGDRGFDLLVGPPELLGSGVAQALVRRLVRVLLHQAAITRVVCACDVRNARLLTFCRALGAQDVATLAPAPPPAPAAAAAAAAQLVGWTSEPRAS